MLDSVVCVHSEKDADQSWKPLKLKLCKKVQLAALQKIFFELKWIKQEKSMVAYPKR